MLKNTKGTGPRCGQCGASVACWLCLGAGKLRAVPVRGIKDGDVCHGCAGVGTTSCRPCLDKLTKRGRQEETPATVRITA